MQIDVENMVEKICEKILDWHDDIELSFIISMIVVVIIICCRTFSTATSRTDQMP